MDKNIRLRLVGITFNQIESGVYALVLEDVAEGRRLAIVIGYPEAQSIECHLQRVRTPRPLSHDLMSSIIQELGAKVVSVFIHKLPSGPYAGRITLRTVWGDEKEIDSRSSDAIALAIRVGAPIYTSKELLMKEGYIPNAKNETKKARGNELTNSTENERDIRYSSIGELEKRLAQSVAEENYEEAARIKLELDSRKKNDVSDDQNSAEI